MKVKVLVGALIFLTVLNLATIGTILIKSDDGPQRLPRGPWGKPDIAGAPWVDLTPEQRQKLRNSFTSLFETTRPLLDSMDRAEITLMDVVLSDSATVEDIEQQMDAVIELRTRMSKYAIRHILESKEYLSKEQQEQILRTVVRMRGGSPFRGGMGRHRGLFQQGPRFERGSNGPPGLFDKD